MVRRLPVVGPLRVASIVLCSHEQALSSGRCRPAEQPAARVRRPGTAMVAHRPRATIPVGSLHSAATTFPQELRAA
jgi:hypothetical protein